MEAPRQAIAFGDVFVDNATRAAADDRMGPCSPPALRMGPRSPWPQDGPAQPPAPRMGPRNPGPQDGPPQPHVWGLGACVSSG